VLIRLNERETDLPADMTLYGIRAMYKSDADLVILNGAPVREDAPIADGDRVVLIKRGEIPGRDELEALMAARHTPGVHERVKNAVVGIAGAGGLGSNAAAALARLGVGTIIIVDFDVVEPSNLNRQHYFVDQIGTPKVLALADTLRRIHPYINVDPRIVRLDRTNCASLFAGADIVVEAFDGAEAKSMLVESMAAVFPKRPVVMASGLAGHESGNSIITRKISDGMYVVGDLVNEARPGRGLMSPRVGIAAHHQANTVLRLLLGETAA